MYHTYVTSFEELEKTLNNISKTEEIFSINTAGTQAIVTTKEEDKKNDARDSLNKKQRLLEKMKGENHFHVANE